MADREADKHFHRTLVWELDERLQHKYKELFLRMGFTDSDFEVSHARSPGHEVAELLIMVYKNSGTKGLHQFYQLLQKLEENNSLALIDASAASVLFQLPPKVSENDKATVFLLDLSPLDLENIVHQVLNFDRWMTIGLVFEESHKFVITYQQLKAEQQVNATEKDLCMALFNKLAIRHVKLGELVAALKKIGLVSVAIYIEKTTFKVKISTPSEILSRGPEAISAYNRALKVGKMKPFRSKLMLVGQARAGKTSLLRAITQQQFDVNESSTHVMDVCNVDVSQWRLVSRITSDFYAAMAIQVTLLLRNRHAFIVIESLQTRIDEEASNILKKIEQEQTEMNKNNSNQVQFEIDSINEELQDKRQNTTEPLQVPFTFSTWDFAGQDVYYSIHPIFITDRAHYIVVFSLKEAAEDLTSNSTKFIHNLDFWIKSISHYTSADTRLFIVGTHADQINQQSMDTLAAISRCIEEQVFMNGDDYIPAYDMLIPNSLNVLFFPVNNQLGFTCDGVKSLVAKLKEDMELQHSSGFLSVEQPLRWLQMQEEIHLISESKSVVTYQELASLAIEKCEIEATDVKKVLQYLHDIGQIIYYSDITDSNGTELVIINPQWLIGCTKDLIPTTKSSNINLSDFKKLKSGSTTIDVLQKIWARHDAKYLIELMKKFGLLCTSDGTNFTVPFSKKIELPKWNHLATNQLICFFKFGQFLPEALFHYMVVHFVNSTTNCKSNFRPEVNRYAAIVMIEDQRCFLQLIPPQHQIKLIIEWMDDHTPAKVVKAIQDQIASLTDLWVKKLSYKVLINCPQCFDRNNGMVVLDTPGYCTASPQCRLTEKEIQKIDMDWNKATNQLAPPKDTVPQEDKLLDELTMNLMWQLNDKLQHHYWELATRLGFKNITLLETKYPGNEVAALLLYLHKRDGSLKPFYQLLKELEETSSLELIDESPAKPLFM